MKLYPRASENRRSIHDPDVRPNRRAFFKEAVINFLYLQILFLCLFSYVFGSLSYQTFSIYNLPVLFVDYDGGAIAAAMRAAYADLQGRAVPTLEEPNSASDIAVADLREEVCSTRYWAVLYVVAEASTRLTSALAGGASARDYDASNAVKMIWNEARYPTVVDSAIEANLKLISDRARSAYLTANASRAVRNANTDDAAVAAILANPWVLSETNIQPTVQGPRVIYNTLVIILVLIQEFFYLGTINRLYSRFRIFATLQPRRIIAVRYTISLAYALIGSLCVSGVIWAFRGAWNVNGVQFAQTWAVLWLFGHINFLVLDIVTVWAAPPFVPMALITWVILNVSSILLPFELNPGFYRWGYALPGHEVFATLLDIWSGGCNPQLQIALPILFAWELVGLAGSALGVYRRCHNAVVADEQQERSFQEHVQTALEHEHAREKQECRSTDKDDDRAEKEQLESIIRREDGLVRHQTEWAGRTRCFEFPLAFESKEDEDAGTFVKRAATAPSEKK